MTPGAGDTAATADALRVDLAAAVCAVAGVARLEPTLRNALHRLHATTTSVLRDGDTVRSAADGIQLYRRGTTVDVHVDIATNPTRAAADTAQEVRDTLRHHLHRHQLTPGSITIAVLTVEHEQTSPSAT